MRIKHPVSIQVWKNPSQVLQCEVHHISIGHLVERVCFRQVFSQVDDMPTAVGFGRLEICVLNNANEREPRIVDV